ncbi:membrane protein insertion efficiency factor YidD [Tahibacter soli]|uniref:Membrane protein insertion efficiency factor YidD n=1 Tax=Tahibacter soli TaxID=2983605 RepID=A0A9X4BKZ0_9GAMM|nr:membrane protein insertion efficiency factor YidD [Tahibacter soli]MDC8016213.1 membrane protein insertion efficiency factor YidD [Tahibacter soli]
MLDRWLSLPARGAMHVYRSVVSPAKGFRCAHAVVTGGPSCSDVALQAFRERPFAAAIGEIDAQFARCQASLVRFDSDLIGQAIASLPTFAAEAQCCDQDGDGVINCCDPRNDNEGHDW